MQCEKKSRALTVPRFVHLTGAGACFAVQLLAMAVECS